MSYAKKKQFTELTARAFKDVDDVPLLHGRPKEKFRRPELWLRRAELEFLRAQLLTL